MIIKMQKQNSFYFTFFIDVGDINLDYDHDINVDKASTSTGSKKMNFVFKL